MGYPCPIKRIRLERRDIGRPVGDHEVGSVSRAVLANGTVKPRKTYALAGPITYGPRRVQCSAVGSAVSAYKTRASVFDDQTTALMPILLTRKGMDLVLTPPASTLSEMNFLP